jgi:D-alanyl-D-alanine carboxypeptidase (penicillin-binding protein 5/6)
MRIITFFLLTIFISQTLKAIDTKAEQAIVVEYGTNEILFEKNADQIMPPASMTKIMTVYAVFDRLEKTDVSLDDLCKVSAKAYKMGGSRTFLEIDDYVSIDDLLKGVIIQSGNDASVVLAECLGGSEKDFAKIMNSYAKKLGMINTNFVNSSGWPDESHYSTVQDLAILSNYLIKDFPKLYTYFKIKEFSYNEINQPNRNKLLANENGADGLKTGYTKKSGWGIAVSALRNGRRITLVINGTNSSRSRLNESSFLLNWAFNQTSQIKLVSKGQLIKNVDVWLGNKSSINLVIEDDILSTVSFDQLQLIETSISYSKPINAPIKKGEQLGIMEIKISGKKNLVIPMVAESDVNETNPFFKLFAAIKYLIFGTSLDEI